MDFLMMWQDGIKNVIATSGTALTPEHLKALKKITDDLVLSFDSDAAGQAAAERSIDLASGLDFNVKLLIIEDPKLKDPADVVKERPGYIAELLKLAKPAMEYYFYKYLSQKEGKFDFKKNKANLRIVLSKIKNLASSIEKNHWIKQLANISKLSESVLMEEMENIKESTPLSNRSEEEVVAVPEEEFSRTDLICQRLIGLAINDKAINEKIKQYLEYFPEFYKKLYSSDKLDGAMEKVREIISLRFSFENANMKEGDIEKEFDQLARELKLGFLREKQQNLRLEIENLEREGRDSDLAVKMKEFDTVSKEMHNIRAGMK